MRNSIFLFAGVFEDGSLLHLDGGERIFRTSAVSVSADVVPQDPRERLESRRQELQLEKLTEIERRNGAFFEEEQEKLDRWADDLKHDLEMATKVLDGQIRAAQQQVRKGATLQEGSCGPDKEGSRSGTGEAAHRYSHGWTRVLKLNEASA